MAKKKKSKSFKFNLPTDYPASSDTLKKLDLMKTEKKIKNFEFKTMSVKIKIGRGAIDPELLRAMGFNVIVDTSVPKGEIHVKHITVPRDEFNG